MKKILLSLIASSAIFYSVNAQKTTISFEASEGFVLGDILGQNENIETFWSDIVSIEETVEVSNEYASDGTNSARIIDYSDEELGGIAIFGLETYEKTAISYNVYVPELGGSDNFFLLYDNGGLANVVNFDYEGIIKIYNFATEAYTEVGNFSEGVWYKVEVKIDFSASTFALFVDGTEMYSGAYEGSGTTIEEIQLAIDNYGTDAYFDNLIVENMETLSTQNISKNTIKVFPNPSADVVNVDTDSKILSIEVFDVSGKSVKTVRGAKSVNVSTLNKGNYIIKVQTENGSFTKKRVKK